MIKLRFFLLSTVVCLGSLSCISLAMKYRTGKTGVNELYVLENMVEEKKIVMIPVLHVETREYYEEVKKYMDSLKNCGYVVFYEGVGLRNAMKCLRLDETEILCRLDTLYRKFRKITGFHIDYMNDSNNGLKPLLRKDKYVYQSREMLGLTGEKDIHVDVNLEDLIGKYESDNGKIALSQYDWITDLNDRYKCSKANRGRSAIMLYHIRNKHIINEILSSQYQKIILVYGKAHIPMIGLTLTNKYGYKIIRGDS